MYSIDYIRKEKVEWKLRTSAFLSLYLIPIRHETILTTSSEAIKFLPSYQQLGCKRFELGPRSCARRRPWSLGRVYHPPLWRTSPRHASSKQQLQEPYKQYKWLKTFVQKKMKNKEYGDIVKPSNYYKNPIFIYSFL